MKFLGYRRPDGKVGIRNKVFILSIKLRSVCLCDKKTDVEGRVVKQRVSFIGNPPIR